MSNNTDALRTARCEKHWTIHVAGKGCPECKAEAQSIAALTAQAAQQSQEPENNWLMQPALDWLENAEHGGEKERCKMIAAMLRDLWRKAQSTTPTTPTASAAMLRAAEYRPNAETWFHPNNVEELTAFYEVTIPRIREAAKSCGYGLGVHGSLKRDLDVIAVPWIEDHLAHYELAKRIQIAACGISQNEYRFTKKPSGRLAISLPICTPDFGYGVTSLGHIDLSVMPDTLSRYQKGEKATKAVNGICDALASFKVNP